MPDVLLMAKGMGGGMPIGAFAAKHSLMKELSHNPVLGHITTFGGHPVSCAAGKAAMEALLDEKMIEGVKEKSTLFDSLLRHNKIISKNRVGLWLALEFDSFDTCKKIIDACIAGGVMTDWFLFASNSLRISPPLVISEAQIKKACEVILSDCN